MNLASIIMFGIWISFVMFLIGAWAVKSTFEQIKDIHMDDDDIRNVL